jgi:hypothetical protein
MDLRQELRNQELLAEQFDDSPPAVFPQGVAVANLVGSVSNPPTQAEVQAIQNKLNELLDSLRGAQIIAP